MGIGSNRRSRGENYLLMFAIDTYKVAPKLNNCVKDVKALRTTLTKYFFYEEDKTTCLFNKKATRRAILNSINKIRAQITEKDSLLIVYSGHGKIVNDYGYWIPVEADPKEDADFISASDITNRLEGIKCRHLFMIIDACFSGTMIKIFKGEEDKLENDELRPSRRVLTSSHNREKALDGTPGENSPFAKIIIQYLNKNKNSVIEVKDLIRFVEKEVKTQTGKEQTPQSGILAIKGHENGQLFIYPKSKLASFEYVLELIQEEKNIIQKEEQEDATNALKNFLLNYKKLPIQHAHHLSFVANRVNRWINLKENKLIIGLYKKRFEREIEIELIKTVLELSKPPLSKENRYYNILEYIALDQTKAALKILVDEVGDKEILFPELVNLISQFHLINRDLITVQER